MNNKAKRMLDKSILGWLAHIETADNKDSNYWGGMTELEFVMSKVVDRLLIRYNRAPPYPQPRIPIQIKLRKTRL